MLAFFSKKKATVSKKTFTNTVESILKFTTENSRLEIPASPLLLFLSKRKSTVQKETFTKVTNQ